LALAFRGFGLANGCLQALLFLDREERDPWVVHPKFGGASSF